MRKGLLMLLIVLSSCSAKRWVETDLYFGLSKPNGGVITDDEWNGFKKDYIGKYFKEGSTTIAAEGNWWNPKSRKYITEPTRVVICLHLKSKAVSKQIDSLREAYKTLFNQQSVLRVDKRASVSF